MNRDELYESMASVLEDEFDHKPDDANAVVDELMPHIDAHVRAALKAQREQIAADIEREGAEVGPAADGCSPHAVRHGMGKAILIVREGGDA